MQLNGFATLLLPLRPCVLWSVPTTIRASMEAKNYIAINSCNHEIKI